MRPRANSILAAIRIATIGAIAFAFLLARADARTQGPAEPGFALGLEILSPSGGVDFADFAKYTLASIKQNWYARLPEDAMLGDKGAVAVILTVNKNGSLTGQGPTTEAVSRYKDMNRAALEAVRASAPFKRLPDGFNGAELKLRVTFFYNVSPPIEKH
jgi:TonB family protein